MQLFTRESGTVGGRPVVFLHGAERTGESWHPVVKRLQQYRCLTPDLPHHGESQQDAAFDISDAATAVAEVIRSRVPTGRVHLVGHSLGAQVAAQLLASAPELVDRAVLAGVVVNALPGVRITRLLLGAVAGFSRSVQISAHENSHHADVLAPEAMDDHDDADLMSAEEISQIVVASAGFTVPTDIERADSPTLFLSGGREMPVVHPSAIMLSQRMPNGVDAIARGMDHDWPLHYPALFARTVNCWLTGAALPTQIELSKLEVL